MNSLDLGNRKTPDLGETVTRLLFGAGLAAVGATISYYFSWDYLTETVIPFTQSVTGGKLDDAPTSYVWSQSASMKFPSLLIMLSAGAGLYGAGMSFSALKDLYQRKNHSPDRL